MALHGSLLSATTAMDGGSAENAGAVFRPPAMGYLASVRDLKLDLEDLGTVAEDLRVSARRLSGDAGGFIYEFEIRAGARAVLAAGTAA
jgi:predicted hotdog family 3-hydroxylacyl-ACP dehydratase